MSETVFHLVKALILKIKQATKIWNYVVHTAKKVTCSQYLLCHQDDGHSLDLYQQK